MEASSVGDRVLSRLRDLPNVGLQRVVAYGSSVTRDVLAGYSDLDLLIGLTAPLPLPELVTLQRSVADLELAPFSYLQPTFVVGARAIPSLVPGSFRVIYGPEPSNEWICDADRLQSRGSAWLAQLPTLLSGDAADWAMTVREHVPRHARLLLTRVKPTLRALLVQLGADPLDAWSSGWPSITRQIGLADDNLKADVLDLLNAARQHQDHLVAESALRVLSRVCAEHLHHSGHGFLALEK